MKVRSNLLGPETGTLETVAVGCTTLATLLIIEEAPSLGIEALVRKASHSAFTLNNSASNSWHL